MRVPTVRVVILAAAVTVVAGAFQPWAPGADAGEVSLGLFTGGGGGDPAGRAAFAGSVAPLLLAIAGVVCAAAARMSRLLTGVAALTLTGLLTIWLVARLAAMDAGEPIFLTGPLVELGALAALVAAATVRSFSGDRPRTPARTARARAASGPPASAA